MWCYWVLEASYHKTCVYFLETCTFSGYLQWSTQSITNLKTRQSEVVLTFCFIYLRETIFETTTENKWLLSRNVVCFSKNVDFYNFTWENCLLSTSNLAKIINAINLVISYYDFCWTVPFKWYIWTNKRVTDVCFPHAICLHSLANSNTVGTFSALILTL